MQFTSGKMFESWNDMETLKDTRVETLVGTDLRSAWIL